MKFIISSILVFLSLLTFAQNSLINSGYSTDELKGVLETLSNLEPAFQKNPTKEMALQIADALLYIRKYKKAISYYEYALSIGSLDEKQTVNYFTSLFEFGDLKTATEVSKEFYLKFGKMTLKAKMDSFEKLSKSTPVFLENFLSMNTKNNEYGLYPLFADYRIINSDIPVEYFDIVADKMKMSNFINPYIVSMLDIKNDTPHLYPTMKVDKYLNTISHYDEKAKEIYVTRNNSSRFSVKLSISIQSTMKIFIGKIDPFFKVHSLTEFKYNSNDYSVGQPCVTRDGQTLYFVSDMPGGYGGTDIYRCMKLEDGSWGAPINLGSEINTTGDEMYPCVSPQGNTLYFSSTGHSIFGGLDLNKSVKTRYNVFSKPTNLGAPFNSNKDDFAIVFTDNAGTEGFFSSNRVGGVGGVDIYNFSYEKKPAETAPANPPVPKSAPRKLGEARPVEIEEEIDFKSDKKRDVSKKNQPAEKKIVDDTIKNEDEIEFKR